MDNQRTKNLAGTSGVLPGVDGSAPESLQLGKWLSLPLGHPQTGAHWHFVLFFPSLLRARVRPSSHHFWKPPQNSDLGMPAHDWGQDFIWRSENEWKASCLPSPVDCEQLANDGGAELRIVAGDLHWLPTGSYRP